MRTPEKHDRFDLIVGITRLANLFNRRLAPVFEKANITPQQWTILTALSGCGPSTLAGLARTMMVSKQNMTGMIARLEEAGYIKRDLHPEDLRSARVVLSVRGKNLVERLRPQYEAWRGEIEREIGERDCAALERAMRKLLEKLD